MNLLPHYSSAQYEAHPSGTALQPRYFTSLSTMITALEAAPTETAEIKMRLGGEEFALLLPETGLEEAVGVAEKVRQLVLEQEFTSEEGHRFEASITCGVSTFHGTEETVEAILHRADQNLYQGKRTGRNRVIADEWDS